METRALLRWYRNTTVRYPPQGIGPCKGQNCEALLFTKGRQGIYSTARKYCGPRRHIFVVFLDGDVARNESNDWGTFTTLQFMLAMPLVQSSSPRLLSERCTNCKLLFLVKRMRFDIRRNRNNGLDELRPIFDSFEPHRIRIVHRG